MSEFAYTTVPGKIPQLLSKLREVGIPPRASTQLVKTIGFTSSNDASLIGVLRQVGLIDASSIPTPVWTRYRGANHKKVLGSALRSGYAELFAVYPDANSRTNSELEHVFSTSSSAGRQVIAKTVSTFKALAENADFDAVQEEVTLNAGDTPLHQPVASASQLPGLATNNGNRPSVHIDIQIHIAPEASVDQIDQIFKSMSKHLYGGRDTE